MVWPGKEGEPERPAHKLLDDLVEQGFLEIFSSQSEAERFLGGPVIASPLGDVVREKASGLKHRLITDLAISLVNSTISMWERQVLPRFLDHVRDLAQASEMAAEITTMLLDYSQAFMTVPLAD